MRRCRRPSPSSATKLPAVSGFLGGIAGGVISDWLILTCPLSPQTYHLVDARVIDALGPQGFLVNIARGPVVDEAALIAALADKRIAGAALDVFEHEPHVPRALIDDPRVVLTPHIGSATEETRTGMADNVVDMLASHFGIAGPRSTSTRVAEAGNVAPAVAAL